MNKIIRVGVLLRTSLQSSQLCCAGDGSLACPELLGNIKIKRYTDYFVLSTPSNCVSVCLVSLTLPCTRCNNCRVLPEDAYGHVLEGRLNPDQRSALLQSLGKSPEHSKVDM